MKKWNKLFALLMALAMVLSLAACSNGGSENSNTPSDNSSAPENSDNGGEATGTKTFVFGSDANCTTFNTATDLETHSGNTLVSAVGETLWTVDNDGNVTCVLAESYDWTGDLELTVKLREGITFSNGNPLTSEDVYYTLTLFRDSGRTASMVAAIDFENTTCPDDNTIVIALSTYDAALFNTLGNTSSFVILDAETCTAEDWAWGWLYGTGAYKLKGDGVTDKSGWEESVQYTLVRNENYWGEAPYYDEIIIKFYSEESTRYAEFQSGTLDACYLTEASYINNVASGSIEDAHLVQRVSQATTGIHVSGGGASCGAMADVNIRKAFAHAIDINAIVEALGEGTYITATSILGPDNWAYYNVGTYEYNPELAAQYLAEAGYSVDNPLTLTVTAESTAFNTAVAEACQAYLAEIGINLSLDGMGDFATILPTLLSGAQEVGMGSPSSNSGNDPASLLQQMGPLSDNVMLRVTDERLIELFNAAAASRDHDERVDLYKEFQQLVYDECLYIPMWVDTINYVVNDAHTSFESALNSANHLNSTALTD